MITVTKGSSHAAPDALSRSPVGQPTPSDELAEDDDAPCIRMISIRALHDDSVNIRLEELERATTSDPTLQLLTGVIRDGFPEHRQELPETLRAYWPIRESLTVDGDLVLYGCRLVIPMSFQKEVLQLLHASHQGISRTKARARRVVYWP